MAKKNFSWKPTKYDFKIGLISILMFIILTNVWSIYQGRESILNLNLFGSQTVVDMGGLMFVLLAGIIAIVITKIIVSNKPATIILGEPPRYPPGY